MKYLGEEFHTVVVIYCQKFVILLLTDFMGYGFAIDNGGHLIFALCFCRLYGNRFHFHFYFPSVFSFPIPSLAFIDIRQVTSVNQGSFLLLPDNAFTFLQDSFRAGGKGVCRF